MLDTTLATEFVPGTNLKDAVAGANWSFLLPSLEQTEIVCVGSPPLSTLITLSRLAQSITVFCSSKPKLRHVCGMVEQADLHRVHPLLINGQTTSRIADKSVDVVLIVKGSGTRWLMRDQVLHQQLRRILKPEGITYVDLGGPIHRFLGGEKLRRMIEDFGVPHTYWITPFFGKEMLSAVPLSDSDTINYFLHKKPFRPSLKLRPLRTAEMFLAKRPLINRLFQRHGVLVSAVNSQPGDHPPLYLRQIAQRSGVCIDGLRWGLSALGNYTSRKVLFFLFEQSSEQPRYVVKITRDRALNHRLENERHALMELRHKGIGDPESLPQVAFYGCHGNLAIVGETAIEGIPFRESKKTTADCPFACSAIDWLIDLGAATSDSSAATPGDIAQGLNKLLAKFVEIYRLTSDQRAFMSDQIAIIADSRQAFPVVFQHGDPGTWNVLVTKGGRAAFLDWEASEPQGMPLWDLYYFIRSCIVWASRARGHRDSLKALALHMQIESPFGQLLAESTRRYCERVNLSSSLVEPLFYTCIMHRALKEATRLGPGRLQQGHYVSLLRICISDRLPSVLRSSFSQPIGIHTPERQFG